MFFTVNTRKQFCIFVLSIHVLSSFFSILFWFYCFFYLTCSVNVLHIHTYTNTYITKSVSHGTSFLLTNENNTTLCFNALTSYIYGKILFTMYKKVSRHIVTLLPIFFHLQLAYSWLNCKRELNWYSYRYLVDWVFLLNKKMYIIDLQREEKSLNTLHLCVVQKVVQ